MPTPEQIQAMNLYRGIMEEAKIRIAAIDAGTSLQLNLPPPIVREHCFLQLRLICELIALGCMVAHGDIKATREPKLQKQWAADKIMEELEKLHPSFYPVAVKQIRTDVGFELDVLHPHPCDKSELLKIYYECGDVLHRGSVKKLLSQTRQPTVIYYPRITALAQKIVNLLNIHTLTTVGNLMFVCIWRAADQNGATQVAIAEVL